MLCFLARDATMTRGVENDFDSVPYYRTLLIQQPTTSRKQTNQQPTTNQYKVDTSRYNKQQNKEVKNYHKDEELQSQSKETEGF